jgi:uncharacterized protein YecE (DUF72 family)
MSARDRARRSKAENQADLFPQPAPAGDASPAPAPGAIRIGTSGYSFADWVGPFYPPGIARGEMLDYYKRHFNTVEVNATYYRLPPPATMQRMAERTPADFHFMVKLPGGVTHLRDADPAPVEGFLRTIAPLQESGKFRGALAQFPFSFKRTAQAEAYLAWLRAAFPGMPLFVEFRHDSWREREVADFLAAQGLGICSIDEPDLPGLIPRWVARVGEVASVRLHGRNAAAWWKGGGERYNYLYAREELAEWAEKIRELADGARQTYVFFNNCHAGHAVVNARMMEELLKLA